MATVAGAARPSARNNASVVTVSGAVWRHSEHYDGGFLEVPRRSTTAVQRRGAGSG